MQRWLSVAAGSLVNGPASARVNVLFGRPQDPRCSDIASQLFKRLDDHLATQPFLTGARPTIADVALYTYTAHAPEGAVPLQPYAHLRPWLACIEALPRFVGMVRKPGAGLINMSNVHNGEREVQLRVGVHERSAAVMQQVIRPAMPEQHIELFHKLPTLLVGGLDAQRRPWATVLSGWPGFMHAPDAQHLRIEALPHSHDPLALQPGMPLGLLGLEPHTRRRNRMNGSVVALDSQGFTLQVDQSFGNCPKYIQARVPRWVTRGTPPPAQPEGAQLSAAARRLVSAADTLFIASSTAQARGHAGAEGVDVSHRGGLPGFVRVTQHTDGATVLHIPDYRGNNFFNTLGNLAVNPRAGLLFIDFERGDLLQLTGHTELLWGEAPSREIRFTAERGLWRAGALPLAWSAPEYAPQLIG